LRQTCKVPSNYPDIARTGESSMRLSFSVAVLSLILLSTTAYGQIYSDVDLLAMQIHSPVPYENWDGFAFSPRVELGYECDTYGLRTRFWHFDNDFEYGPTRFGTEFDVLDLEATKKLGDFTVSGGFRVAGESFYNPAYITGGVQQGRSEADTTQFGVTFAADGDTKLCGGECWCLSAVYGARLSLLEGDWHNTHVHNSGLESLGQTGNDIQSATEAHAGIEGRYGFAFSRVELEIQRWSSDSLNQVGWNDIGFLGIGTTVGVRF
jgi:hypothetical protein